MNSSQTDAILKRLAQLENQVDFLSKELFTFRREPYDPSKFENPPITSTSPWGLLFRQRGNVLFKPGEYTKNVRNPNSNCYANLDINYDTYRTTVHYDYNKEDETDNDDANKNETETDVQISGVAKDDHDNYTKKHEDKQLVFLLLWPNIHLEDSELIAQGMIWIQETTPMENKNNNRDVDGYYPIFVPYPGKGEGHKFHGLHRATSRSDHCLINGMSNGNNWWYYCIGCITPYDRGQPGPIEVDKYIIVHHTELYILNAKHAKLKYAMYIFQNSKWKDMDFDIACVIAQYGFDKREIMRQSLHLLYP